MLRKAIAEEELPQSHEGHVLTTLLDHPPARRPAGPS